MKGRTTLSEEAFGLIVPRVLEYVRTEGAITNSQLRRLSGMNYDQAIRFFNLAVERGLLERRGHASGTHYTGRSSE